MAFKDYAAYYDIFYKNKDYRSECDFLEALFHRYSQRKVNSILDLGCGTANHLIPLLKRRYKTAGIDASSAMLRIARSKIESLGLKADLKQQKLESFRFVQKFDAVVCLFSVIDYVVSLKHLRSMLKNISRHLKSGGIFVFDFWQEDAVVNYFTGSKSRVYERGGIKIERSSQTKIFPKKKISEVNYTCRVFETGQKNKIFKEKHILRYFSVEEMKSYLNEAGFKVVHASPFMQLKGKIKKNTWDVTMVALKE